MNSKKTLNSNVIKSAFIIVHVIASLAFCQFAAAVTPVQLDTRDNLEADGIAKNDFSHDIKIQLHPHTEVIG